VAPILRQAVALCVLVSHGGAGFFQRVSFQTAPGTCHSAGSKLNNKTIEPSGQKININRATVHELQRLPGVGPTLAQRILDYRKKNPPFRRVEELLLIKGISRDKLERMRSRISVQ
jgi:competence ComEA-like helix-hairpin-helix protein